MSFSHLPLSIQSWLALDKTFLFVVRASLMKTSLHNLSSDTIAQLDCFQQHSTLQNLGIICQLAWDACVSPSTSAENVLDVVDILLLNSHSERIQSYPFNVTTAALLVLHWNDVFSTLTFCGNSLQQLTQGLHFLGFE